MTILPLPLPCSAAGLEWTANANIRSSTSCVRSGFAGPVFLCIKARDPMFDLSDLQIYVTLNPPGDRY
jgi:hypothetical protein